MNALETLATWIADSPRDHGPSATAPARRAFLDTLGCMLAGARDPAVEAACAAMSGVSAEGPCAIAGRAGKAAPETAAFINGMSAHALDYDDYERAGSTHPSAVLVPALMALGETRSLTVGALLEAYVAGFEAIVRIGEWLGYDHYVAGWHATGTIGPFGAAAGCARLLGLSAEQTAHAMALAASMSSGLKAQFGTGAKAMHAGLATRSGITVACLAEAGLSAAPGVLEGGTGYLRLYDGASAGPAVDDSRPSAFLDYGALPKPYPCCACFPTPRPSTPAERSSTATRTC